MHFFRNLEHEVSVQVQSSSWCMTVNWQNIYKPFEEVEIWVLAILSPVAGRLLPTLLASGGGYKNGLQNGQQGENNRNRLLSLYQTTV